MAVDAGRERALYAVIAALWLIPDRRIERTLTVHDQARPPGP